MIKGLIADILVIGGLALVGVGLWHIYWPVSLIWGGLAMTVLGAMSVRWRS
jgi:hypothetical protein